MCGLEEVGLPNEFCLFIQGERERERERESGAEGEGRKSARLCKKKAYIEKEEKRWPFMNMLRPR